MVGGEVALTRKKITSGHRSTQPHFHVRNQFRIWTGSPIGYSHVKLFDVANQGHYYIVNSLRTWEYPIDDPVQIPCEKSVQILNWFLTWKWGCVLLWPEVIFFLVNATSPPTISIDKKKISSGTQGTRLINAHSVLFRNVARLNLQFVVLDLNTGLARVVKTLPDETFSFDMGKQRRNTYTVSIRQHPCSILWWARLFGFVSILCLGHWICSCLTFSIPQHSNYKF